MSKTKKISSLIPKIFKSFKKNPNLIQLQANWEEIVGKRLSERCFVHGLKRINKKNVLIIISSESDILELSYLSEKFKKKINNFYSKEFINVIKFKKSLQT